MKKNNLFFKSKINLSIIIFKRFCIWNFFSILIIFLFISIYRLYIYWQLNKGLENIKIFSLIQFFDIQLTLMEGFPYVLVFIFPFFMFELNNKNFFTRIIFSNIRLSIIVLFLIFLVLLLGASIFYMKEKFAYSWKIRGRELYDKYKNTFDNNPIDYYLSVEGKFILLSADSILYYYKMGNRDGKNILFDIIMDKSTNKEELVIAEKAELRHQEIFFEKGKIVKLNNNLINKNYINFFSKYKVQIFADLENIFLGRAELKYLNTKTIFQFLRHLEKYEERSLKYIRNILLGRIMPNAIGFIIILFQAFLFLFFYQKHQFYVALLLSSFGLIIISSAVSLVSL